MENFQYKNIFTPYKIGKLTIKNRLSVAPMGYIPFNAQGAYTDDGINYVVERAKGGFGLIFPGAVFSDTEVDPFFPLDIMFLRHSPGNFIKTSILMNNRVHAYGAKIFCQVTMGVGRNFLGFKTPSGTAYFHDANMKSEALTRDEIKRKIEIMVESAAIVKSSGYDGIEIHAMHWGYLLDQLAMSITNQRTDEYGGSLENRMRAAKEVVEGIKQECGSDFPVSMRLGLKSYIKGLGYGQASVTGEDEAGRTLEEGLEICRMLEAYGYDCLSVDVGVYDSFYHACPPMYIPKGQVLPLAAEAKKVVGIPILTSNRMDDPQMCEDAIAYGKTDAIVLGRASLADPYYARKLQCGNEDAIRPCIACNQGCIGPGQVTGAVSCAVNPTAYRELSYGVKETSTPKKIAVVGGGVAGMEAARTATMRGHEVTLYEAGPQLGGNLVPGGTHSFKQDVQRLNKWYQRELNELKVDVRLNTKADAVTLREAGADAVILAVGASPVVPNIPGIDKALTSIDVLSGKKEIGEKVVVIGGGLVGCEIALEHAMEGKSVTVIEAMDSILSAGALVPIMNKMALEDLLSHHKVAIRTGCKVESVNDEGVVITEQAGGKQVSVPADTVVLAIGFRPLPSMAQDMYGCGADIYEIGDGREVGTIMSSIWDGYEVARAL